MVTNTQHAAINKYVQIFQDVSKEEKKYVQILKDDNLISLPNHLENCTF